MRITIEATDIETANRGNTKRCMIAAALQRTFPDRKISVSVDRIQMEEPSGQRVFALTPFSVSAKIIAFDWWKRSSCSRSTCISGRNRRKGNRRTRREPGRHRRAAGGDGR